ncbi:MAG: lipoate--protein ligase, partial [Acholeplasmataceae bacterium]|nr:lipoate--protein ligase [Acholeplasmataceae bacterium]
DPTWIYKKQPPHTKTLKRRLSGGLFEIILDLSDGYIRSLSIRGDFFDTKSLESFEKQFQNVSYDLDTIEKILMNHPIEDYILDANSKEFIELLKEGMLTY